MLSQRFPISTGIFAAIIFCFFLPFLEVKCNDAVIADLSGAELALGRRLNLLKRDRSGSLPQTEVTDMEAGSVSRNYFALAALVLALAGAAIALSLRPAPPGDGSGREMLLGITGLSGAMCLLLMKIQLETEIASADIDRAKYVINLEFRYGYWLALVLFMAVAFMHIQNFRLERKKETAKRYHPHPESEAP